MSALKLFRCSRGVTGVFFIVVLLILVPAVCPASSAVDPLSENERAWLSRHDGKIRLGHDPNARPVDYLDEKGQFKGLAADYVRLIEKRLNFKFDILKIDTWDEVLRRAKNREVDVLCTFTKNEDREKWMHFTEPYLTIKTVILTRNDFTGDLSLEKMDGRVVTFTKGWVVDDYLKKNYSHIKMLPAIDADTAMHNLLTKKADAWITALTVASIKIEDQRVTNLRIAGETDLSFKLAFASRKDRPVLHSILSKGLARISQEERTQIFNKWIHIGQQSIFHNKTFWAVVLSIFGASVIMILTVFAWNKMLKLKVEEKTQALEKERQLFKTIIDRLPLMISRYDPDANILFLNREFESKTGWTTQEVADIDLMEKIYPDPEYRQTAKDYMQKATSEWKEFKVYARSGRVIDSEWSNIRLEDGTNIGIGIDITDQKRTLAEKERLVKELHQSQKMESIGNLAGGIAHDFNNILTSIIGFTELALTETKKGSSLEDSLQEVYAAGKRAKDLVKQILAFARRSDEKTRPIQPAIVAKEVVKFIRSAIPTTVEIRQDIHSESWIMGNATQVHQVLMNLCTNAAHALEDRGGILEIGVTDRFFDSKDVPPDLSNGDYVEIKVSDTGVGIAPDILDSIFEPYFTTKGHGEGTGMGLAMAQGVVEGYGGKITVHSELGKGSTFRIYLPATKKQQAIAPYVKEKLPKGTEHILFVDDETAITKMGSQMLERLGYRVSCRTDSTGALALFRAKPDTFDLVITDMTMPKLTGDMLAVELMQIRPDIPVILCTGYSKKVSDRTASQIGIKAFAYKPMVMSDLAQTVRKVLDGTTHQVKTASNTRGTA